MVLVFRCRARCCSVCPLAVMTTLMKVRHVKINFLCHVLGPVGLIVNGSSLSVSGNTLFNLSINGTSWSTLIWMRLRVPDISFIFWICSACFANRFWRSAIDCMMLWMIASTCGWTKELNEIQLTLPKSTSHKSNNRLSRSFFQVLFSLYSTVFTSPKSKYL